MVLAIIRYKVSSYFGPGPMGWEYDEVGDAYCRGTGIGWQMGRECGR